MRIGQRIRQLRKERCYCQAQLETASDLPDGYVSKLEEGQTVASWGELERVASAMDVPMYRLFWTDNGPIPTPHLTPRPSLEELACEGQMTAPEKPLLLSLRDVARSITAAKRGPLVRLIMRLVIYLLNS